MVYLVFTYDYARGRVRNSHEIYLYIGNDAWDCCFDAAD